MTLFIGTVACTPDPLPIEIEQAEPQLVVASQVVPNQLMLVMLSKSFGALEFSESDSTAAEDLLDQLAVDSAIVTIEHQGNTDTLFELTSGVYLSFGLNQTVGGTFRLEVQDTTTGLTAFAETTMMEQARIDTVILRKDSIADFPFVEVETHFTDLPGDNFYVLNYYDNIVVEGDTLPFALDSNIHAESRLVRDIEFQDNQIIFTHQLFDWPSDTVIVSLSNVEEGYFDYLTARERGGSGFAGALGEPITYPSNVSSGYGYFTSHYPHLFPAVLE